MAVVKEDKKASNKKTGASAKKDTGKSSNRKKGFSSLKKSGLSAYLQNAQVPSDERSPTRAQWARFFKPKHEGNVTEGKKEKPAFRWVVRNGKTGKGAMAVEIVATTPAKAARWAMNKVEGWNSDKAYISDGRKLVMMHFEKQTVDGRSKIVPMHTEKGKGKRGLFRPAKFRGRAADSGSATHHYTSSAKKSTGNKRGRPKKQKEAEEMSDDGSDNEAGIKAADIHQAAVIAGKIASHNAPAGEKRLAAAAAKEIVEAELENHPNKTSAAEATKAAKDAEDKTEKAVSGSAEAKQAAAKAANKAVKAALGTPGRRSARLEALNAKV